MWKGHGLWLLLMKGIAFGRPEPTETTPRLSEPGDAATISGVAIMLHMDTKGQEFVSVVSTTSIKTYGDYTHIHDFSPAVELEDRLRNVSTTWKKRSKTQTTIIPSSSTRGASYCDCTLAPLKEVTEANQPRRTQWKFDHKEIQNTEVCPHQQEEVYATMLNHPSMIDPMCVITPTRWTQHHIDGLRHASPREVMKQMNKDAKGPCAQEGSYNLRSLPRERVHTQNVTTMLDCALTCLFMMRCTAWTFDMEGQPRCWSIDIGYLRPNFIKGDGGPYVTGNKECVPCLLRRKIEVETSNGMVDARRFCKLDAPTGWKPAAKCACSRYKTLDRFKALMEEITRMARTNSIKEAPKNRGKLSLLVDRILRELRTTRGGLVGLAHTLTKTKSAETYGREAPTLPLVQKFKQLIGSGVEVYAKLIPVARLINRRDSSPKPETTLRRENSITKYVPTMEELHNGIATLGTGRKAAAAAIETNLETAKRFLHTAELQKTKVLRMETGLPGYKDVYNDPNTDVVPTANALAITVDTGAEAAQIAIYAHRGTAQSTTITALPLPTTLPTTGYVPGGVTGHWTSPNHYNRKHPTQGITETCAWELRARQPRPPSCTPKQATEPTMEFTEVKIDQQGSILRLVRIVQDPTQTAPLTITCNRASKFVKTLGVLLLIIGEACSITDEHGQTLTPVMSTGGDGQSGKQFEILFDKASTAQTLELDTTDAVQLIVAGGLTLVAVLITVWLIKERKKRTAALSETTNPVELEQMHPEAGTPPKTPTAV